MIKDNYINDEKFKSLKDVSELKEILWLNPKLKSYEAANSFINLDTKAIDDAEKRLEKFAPLIEKIFPETEDTHGIIESPMQEIEKMRMQLEKSYNAKISGKLLLKMDSHLPIAGSVKARGGIYEVLKYAEDRKSVV